MTRCIMSMCFLLLFAAPVWGVQEGDVVVIKADADMKVSGKVVGKVKAGQVQKVHAVRGAWVEVGDKTRGWVRTDNVTSQQDAIDHVSTLLEKSPHDVNLLITRARMHLPSQDKRQPGASPDNEKLEAALRDLEQARLRDPANGEVRYYLAQLEFERKNVSGAIDHLNKAIELKDDDARFYALRGKYLQMQRDIPKATQDFEKVVSLGEADAEIYNALAWWYATNTDSTFRNGATAVKYALKACELTHYDNWALLDTLAAAYAEYNDFTNAVKWQEEAVKQCNNTSEKGNCEARLKQYRLNQPYREAPR